MIDKVKALKIEDSVNGSSTDGVPTETNPSSDYLAAKGISFENSDTYLLRKLGRFIDGQIPDWSNSVNYLGNGEIDYIEFFQSFTQITANRIARIDFAYDGNLNPITETWSIYDTNGTSVLKTVIFTHSFTGSDYTNTQADES